MAVSHSAVQVLKHYFGFLNDAAAEWKESTAQVKRALHRTSENGPRYHPPNWMEFQVLEHSNSRFESIRFVMRIDPNRFV